MTLAVLRLDALGAAVVRDLFSTYDLDVKYVADNEAIPGSFWGDCEAGLIGQRIFVRQDTPVHSVFHEACHYICMDVQRRQHLHTDAGGTDVEENAVCYLQIVLADYCQGFSRERMLADMDAWGYSFRLGAARAWFEQDAEDARQWLIKHQLIDHDGRPTWRLRVS
jgi:hypothetical protein